MLRGDLRRPDTLASWDGPAPVIVRQWPGERATRWHLLFGDRRQVGARGVNLTRRASTLSCEPDLAPRSSSTRHRRRFRRRIGAGSSAGRGALRRHPLQHGGVAPAGPGRTHLFANEIGSKLIRDNVVFQTYGYGLHFYAEQSFLRGLHGGWQRAVRERDAERLQRADRRSAAGRAADLTNNLTYQRLGDGCVWLGRVGPANGPATVRGNVIAGGDPSLRLMIGPAASTVDSNTIVRLDGNSPSSSASRRRPSAGTAGMEHPGRPNGWWARTSTPSPSGGRQRVRGNGPVHGQPAHVDEVFVAAMP